jgi:hypothetical protein
MQREALVNTLMTALEELGVRPQNLRAESRSSQPTDVDMWVCALDRYGQPCLLNPDTGTCPSVSFHLDP